MSHRQLLQLAVVIMVLLYAVTVRSTMSTRRTRKEFQDDPFLNDTFPGGFLWAAATASYQIEGSWNVDGMPIDL